MTKLYNSLLNNLLNKIFLFLGIEGKEKGFISKRENLFRINSLQKLYL